MAIHKPMAVGGTRVVGSGMRVGRPPGGSSWSPRPAPCGSRWSLAGWRSATSATTSASPCPSPARCCWPSPPRRLRHRRRRGRGVRLHRGGGAHLRLAGARSPSAARRSRRCSPTWVRPRGGVPGGAAGGRAAHPGSEDRGGRGPGRHPARALAGRGPHRRLGPDPGAIARRVLAGGGPDGADGADGRRDPDHGPPAAGPQSVAALAGPAREARAGWSTRATSGGPSPRHSPAPPAQPRDWEPLPVESLQGSRTHRTEGV